MKKRIAILTAVMLLLSGLNSFSWAAKNVTVTLPLFSITLNGKSIDNSNRKYPLIVYNDITYFPMTYYDCRFLGVETKYKKETGLQVIRSGIPQPYNGETSSQNKKSYTATTAQFPIKINGKTIDNSKEQYPFLLFRDVTYFPLTYKFAAEEFDWDYNFNQRTGLTISEKTENKDSTVNTVTEISLPNSINEDGRISNFTIAGDYLYYEGGKGIIYQSPVSTPSSAKSVYQLPEGYGGEGTYVNAGLETKNNKAFLTYHVGGATMGSDVIIRFHDDGTAEQLVQGKYNIEIFKDYTIQTNHFLPAVGNNLYIKKNTGSFTPGNIKEGFVSLGQEGYYYGWSVEIDENSSGYGACKDYYLIGDELYLAAAPGKGDLQGISATESSKVYSVNIKTGKVQPITKGFVHDFQIANNKLYFRTPDYKLYKKDLSSSGSSTLSNKEELLAENVEQFVALGDNVFYQEAVNIVFAGTYVPEINSTSANTHADPGQLFKVGDKNSINPNGIVKRLLVLDDYIYVYFTAISNTPYKMMVLNKNGNVIYRSLEDHCCAQVYKNQLIFLKKS